MLWNNILNQNIKYGPHIRIRDTAVSLKGTQYSTATDSGGNFTLGNIPTGSYTLVISSPDFAPAERETTVEKGETSDLTNLPTMTTGSASGDIDGDGKIGLAEAIHALLIASGIAP